MKKTLSLLLALVMLLGMMPMTAFAAGEPEAAEPAVVGDSATSYKEEIVIAYSSVPTTADPYMNSGTQTRLVTNMTFRQLGYYNQQTGEIEDQLAVEWTQNSDATVWTIKLRDGVKDHIGGTLGADDVLFTFNRIIDGSSVMAPNTVFANMFASARAVDDLTVEVTCKQPVADFPNQVCDIKVYSKDAFDSGVANPGYISYGPYKWTGQNDSESCTVEAFEDFYEGERPTKRIKFVAIPDVSTQMVWLEAGEGDIALSVNDNYYPAETLGSHLTRISNPSSTVHYLAWNSRREIANNKAVTDAIAKAIDKEAILEAFGPGFVINNMAGNYGSPGYVEIEDPYTYDPAAAKAELKAAGYDEGELELTLMYYAYHKPIHEVLEANLTAIGVKVIMKKIDGTVYRALCEEGEYDITTSYFGMGSSVNYAANRYYKANGAGNWFGYEPTEEIANQFAICEAQTIRENLMKEAAELQKLCAEDTRYIPLMTGTTSYTSRAAVQGLPQCMSLTYADFSTVYEEVEDNGNTGNGGNAGGGSDAGDSIIASGECGDNLAWTLDENGVLTISGTGAMDDFGSGDAPWYDNKGAITNVLIGDGVTSIGECAFYGCSALEEIDLPAGLTSIGYNAFSDCSSLKEIVIPDGVTEVGMNAFYRCTGLETIVLPEGLLTFGAAPFYDCEALTEITIPASVTTMGERMFPYCDTLSQVTFLGDAPSFESDTFDGVTATVYYPAGNATWTDAVKQNYGGNLTWMAYGEPKQIMFKYGRVNGSTFDDSTSSPQLSLTGESGCSQYIRLYYGTSSNPGIALAVRPEDVVFIPAGSSVPSANGEITVSVPSDITTANVLRITFNKFCSGALRVTVDGETYEMPVSVVVPSSGYFTDLDVQDEYTYLQNETAYPSGKSFYFVMNDEDGYISANSTVTMASGSQYFTTELVNTGKKVTLDDGSTADRYAVKVTVKDTTDTKLNLKLSIVYCRTNGTTRSNNFSVRLVNGNEQLMYKSGRVNGSAFDDSTNTAQAALTGNPGYSQYIRLYYGTASNPGSPLAVRPEDVVFIPSGSSTPSTNGEITVSVPKKITTENVLEIRFQKFCSGTLRVTLGGEVYEMPVSVVVPNTGFFTNLNVQNESTYMLNGSSYTSGQVFYFVANESYRYIAEGANISVVDGAQYVTAELVNTGKKITLDGNTFDRYAVKVTVKEEAAGDFWFKLSIPFTDQISTFTSNYSHTLVDGTTRLMYKSGRINGSTIDDSTSTAQTALTGNPGNSTYIRLYYGTASNPGSPLVVSPEDVVFIPNGSATSSTNGEITVSVPSNITTENVLKIRFQKFCSGTLRVTVGGETYEMPISVVVPNEGFFTDLNVQNESTYLGNGSSYTSEQVFYFVANDSYRYIAEGANVTVTDGAQYVTAELVNTGKKITLNGNTFDRYAVKVTVKENVTGNFWFDLTIPFTSQNSTYTNRYGVDLVDGTTGDEVPEIIATGECGDNLTWTLDENGLLTISGTGAMEKYDDEDSAPWQNYASRITSVIISDGVTTIGDYAFYRCANATEISVPNSVTAIGARAFSGCNALTAVNIPNGVTAIYEYTFSGCSSLTQVTVPSSVSRIWDGAFDGAGLTTLTIPDSVISIWNRAFDGCNDLTEVTVGKNVSSLGERVFAFCKSLKSVTFTGDAPSTGASNVFVSSNTATAYYPAGNDTWTEDARVEIDRDVRWVSYGNPSVGQNGFDLILSVEDNLLYYQLTLPATESAEAYYVRLMDANNTCMYSCSVWSDEDYKDHMWALTESGTYDTVEVRSYTDEDTVLAQWTLSTTIVVTAGATTLPSTLALEGVDKTEDGTTVAYKLAGAETGLAYSLYDEPNSCVYTMEYDSKWGTVVWMCNPSKTVELYSLCASQTATAYTLDISAPADVTVPEYVPGKAIIASGTCGTNLTWTLDEDGLLTISGEGKMDWYSSSTPSPWDSYQNEIKQVVLEPGVTSIGVRAFAYCVGLTTIEIPGSVTSIDGSAFIYCSNLASVELPAGVTSIGNLTFYGCSSLASIELPAGVTSIGDSAFYGCSSLTTIDLPDGVTSIGGGAFEGCSSLTSIDIPAGVTSIADRTFDCCSNLTYVEIPDSVTFIGDYAFYGCSSLASIELPAGVTSIGDYTFDCCRSLTTIDLPDGVTSIGRSLFWGCSSLASIELPAGVTSIGDYAFYGCSSLTSIELPAGVTSIDNLTFYGCSSLTSIELPAGVTSVGESAFAYCRSLTAITFTDDAPAIGDEAFLNVTATVYYPAGNDTWTEEVMQDYGGTLTWVAYGNPSGTCGANLIWILDENGLLTISGTGEMDSFSSGAPWNDYLVEIKQIVLEPGVTSIGYNAFKDCSSLTSIEIPDSVTSIGGYAFCSCSNLGSIDIPDSVTSLGSCAFSNCISLTSIEIPENVTSIGLSTFNNCSSLVSIELPKRLTSIGTSAFYHCSSLASIEIPEGLTAIGIWVFSGCSSLTSIEIPDAVTSIGFSAFAGCSSLTSIEIPENVTTLSSFAFANCSGLSVITFKGDAHSNATSAFDGVTATAYYPCDKASWTADAMQNYGGTIQWEKTHGERTATVTAPTCTKQGYTTYTCACGDSYVDNYTDASGKHTYVSGTCTGCGDTKPAPAITTQPSDVETAIGQRFSVSFEVSGDGLTYQWYYKDAGMKAFATSSNKTSAYAYAMQTYMHKRQVYCVITDAYGNQVTTDTATITRPPIELKILTQPQSVETEIGVRFSVSPVVQGDGLTYQWYYKENGGKDFYVSSNKTSAYSYSMVGYMHGRQVYCVITDEYGNQVTTDVATITRPPVELKILTQPQDVEVNIGKTATITVEVQGDGLTYQWYYKNRNGVAFAPSSYKSKSYSITMAEAYNGRQVYCVITDQYGDSVTTETVTMSRPPVELKLLSQPEDVYAVKGEKFSVSAKVQGDGLTYQWYYKESYQKKFSASSNKTSAYSYAMQSYMDNRQVYCVITDQYGNRVATEVVTLKIVEPELPPRVSASDGNVYFLEEGAAAGKYKIYRLSSGNTRDYELTTVATLNKSTNTLTISSVNSYPNGGIVIPAIVNAEDGAATYSVSLDAAKSPFYSLNTTGASVTLLAADGNLVGVSGKSTRALFETNDSTTFASLDVSALDTSNVTYMDNMFFGCSSLTELDVSGFDTSNVTSMSGMFCNCSSLTELDVSGFDTSNVTIMGAMFDNCSGLTKLDVSSFDTSNVTDMNGMFDNCASLTKLDLSNFDTSSVLDMRAMFQNCRKLATLNISGFDTANVTDLGFMFNACSSLAKLDVSGFDTSNVIDMSYMFYRCANLRSVDISGWDMSNADTTDMFTGCPAGNAWV